MLAATSPLTIQCRGSTRHSKTAPSLCPLRRTLRIGVGELDGRRESAVCSERWMAEVRSGDDAKRRNSRDRACPPSIAGVCGGFCGAGAETPNAVSHCSGNRRLAVELRARNTKNLARPRCDFSDRVAAAVVLGRVADVVAGFQVQPR